jgi:hypothetical protein
MTTVAQNQAWMNFWNNRGPRPTDGSVFTGWGNTQNPNAPALQSPTQGRNQSWMRQPNLQTPTRYRSLYPGQPAPAAAPAANPYTNFGSSAYPQGISLPGVNAPGVGAPPAPTRFGFPVPPQGSQSAPAQAPGKGAGLKSPAAPPVTPNQTWTRTGITAGLHPTIPTASAPAAPNWLKTLGDWFNGLGSNGPLGGLAWSGPQGLPNTSPTVSVPSNLPNSPDIRTLTNGLQQNQYGVGAGLPNVAPPPPSIMPAIAAALKTVGIDLSHPALGPLGLVQKSGAPGVQALDATLPTPTDQPITPNPNDINMNQLMHSDNFRIWYNYVDPDTGQRNADYWDSLTPEQQAALVSQINSNIQEPRRHGVPTAADVLGATEPDPSAVPELGTQPDNGYSGYGYTPYPWYQNNYYYGGGYGNAPAHWLTNLTNWNIS